MKPRVEIPAFRADHQVEISDERVVFVSFDDTMVVEHRLIALLAPLVDGQKSVSEIAEALEDSLSVLDVWYGLSLLEERGLVVEADAELEARQLVVRDQRGIDAESFKTRLQTTRIGLTSLHDGNDGALAERLLYFGLELRLDPRLEIFMVSSYLDPRLAEHAVRCRSEGRTMLPVKVSGAEAWIGPFIEPGGPSCFACLEARLRANFGPRPKIDRQLPTMMTTEEAASSLAATAAYRWVVEGGHPELTEHLLSLDPFNFESELHRLVPRSCCELCSSSEARRAKPVELSAAMSSGRSARTRSTAEVWRSLEHHISPITGIVPELRRHKGGPEGVPIYIARPSDARPDSVRRHGLRSKTAGKGETEDQARLGALCEALERYVGLHRGDEPRRRSSFVELGNDAIHPNDCMLFSDRQLEQRDQWNVEEAAANWVPERFDEAAQIDWSPLWSLSEGCFQWLPTGYCFYDAPEEGGLAYCRADSNGTAAGSCLEEAIVHGLLELVERDAAAIWWYNRLRRPAVRLESFDNAYLRSMESLYSSLGRSFWVLDLSNDLEIPAFVAVSGDLDGDGSDIILGFGAHLDAELGVVRAVCEMNQLLANHQALGDRADRFFVGPARGSFLDPLGQTEAADSGLENPDLKVVIESCVARFSQLGLETLVLDQSREEVGLSVAKVVVPGLRPFWSRYARGRLYEVPVKLGWLEAPTPESDLNPIHLLI